MLGGFLTQLQWAARQLLRQYPAGTQCDKMQQRPAYQAAYAHCAGPSCKVAQVGVLAAGALHAVLESVTTAHDTHSPVLAPHVTLTSDQRLASQDWEDLLRAVQMLIMAGEQPCGTAVIEGQRVRQWFLVAH